MSAPKQRGRAMSQVEFQAWRQRMGLSLWATARVLGLSRRTVEGYGMGRPIARIVKLACEALETRKVTADAAGWVAVQPIDRRRKVDPSYLLQ